MTTKKKAAKTKKATEQAVVICTDHEKRGVFFGYATGGIVRGKITLKRARMAVYWSRETKGVLGLAAGGPQAGSRITPAVPSVDLEGATCRIECDAAAIAAWENGTWATS